MQMAEIDVKSPCNVGELAEMFDVTPNTVRNWAKRYAEFLSAGANPGVGHQRTFSTRDVNVFSFVSSYLADGLNHDEIRGAIALKSIPDDQPVSIVDDAEDEAEETKPARLEPSMVDLVLLVDKRFDELRANDAQLNRRLANMEQARFNTMAVLTAFALGVLVTVAGLMMGLLLWVNLLAP